MIDFNSYECLRLDDVAEFRRAKKGHVYPRGTSTIQISATKGDIGYLEGPNYIEEKHVAIIPQAGINPKYFNVIIQKNIGKFLQKYKTGLNIQEHEIGNFPIEIHNTETQDAIEKLFEYLDTEERIIKSEINALEAMKNTMLDGMFV